MRRVHALTALGIGAALFATSMGCGETVDAVVVVTHTDASGQARTQGERLRVGTGYFYQDADALYADVAGERVLVSPQVARLPLQTRPLYVVTTVAALHDDAAAQDRGRRLLPFGSTLNVASNAALTAPNVHLLVDNGIPTGFVRAADLRATSPSVDEMLKIAKQAMRDNDLGRARRFASSALAADSKSVGARRLLGALQNRDGDPEGWRLWTSARPPPPRAVDLPAPPAVAGPGRAWLVATDVALRERPTKRSARLALLRAGTAFDVAEVKAGWAKVTLLHKGGEVWRAVVAKGDLRDDAIPWKNATAFTPGQSAGYISAALLSTAPPDAGKLAELADARVFAKRFDEALVPLTRALALRPHDDGVRGALYAAAVEAEQYVLALSVLDDVRRTVFAGPAGDAAGPALSFAFERIAGCHGDRGAARDNVIPHEGLLAVPTFGLTYTPGVFDPAAMGQDVCVIDDEPGVITGYEDSVDEIDQYFGGFCGNEPEVEIGPAQKKEYAAWAKKRHAEIDARTREHQKYLAAFSEWSRKRESHLPGPSVRFQLTANTERAAGTLVLYSFNWRAEGWCGDLTDVARDNLVATRLRIPSMGAGQTLELWIEDADVTADWGVFVDDEGATNTKDYLKAIASPPRDGAPSDRRFLVLPAKYDGLAAETRPGTSMQFSDDCCGC